MKELILQSKKMEIDVFDRSLYPFYDKSSAGVLFRSIQSESIQKASLDFFCGRTMNSIISNLSSQNSKKNTKILAAEFDAFTRSMIDQKKWVLKVTKNKDGFLPTLYDENGKFVKQVVLKNEELNVNEVMKSKNFENTLSNLYIQQQMGEIIELLENLNQSLSRVERGQIDDRIGLYLSSKQQFLEALNIENQTFKQLSLSNAIKSANDARFQLMKSVNSNVRQMIQNQKLKTKDKDELLNNIRESMQYVNEATQLCISAYSLYGEDKAQIAVLQSYRNFIDTVFLDKNENRTNAEILHTNWNGIDSDWLKFPTKLQSNIKEIIDIKYLYLQRGK